MLIYLTFLPLLKLFEFMRAIKLACLSILGSLIMNGLYAQSSSKYQESVPRQNLYVELGGNGIAFNVMYESRLKKSSDGLGIKAGFGGFSGNSENLFTLPVGLNWLLTKDNKNFFEIGFGATFLHYDEKQSWYWPDESSDRYPVNVIGMTVDQKNSVFGHLTLGYRRQPSSGGLTWGVAVTPHFNQNGFWPLWIGLKFGYSISKK
jgi:hypothetical protein